MIELTERQKEILQAVKELNDLSGFPPTRAELARYLGFRSINAAVEHLKALERKGAIEILPGASRGIRLVQQSGLPLVGRVAAGQPILAQEHIEAHCQFDPQLFKPHADYLLRVQGQSMRDAGILDGDLLAVHRTSEARSGQIVVARIGDEVTVKRLRRSGTNIQLLPANPDFEPIDWDRRTPLVIEGLGVGIIRNKKLG